MKTCYIATPVTDFGSEDQAAMITTVERWRYEVVRPDTAQHEAGYKKHGMQYFMQVVRNCDALAYMTFHLGALSAGVAQEILEAIIHGKTVYHYNRSFNQLSEERRMPAIIMSIEETRDEIRRLRALIKAKPLIIPPEITLDTMKPEDMPEAGFGWNPDH